MRYPADPVRFLEKCVVPREDLNQQSELLNAFEERLKRAFTRSITTDHNWRFWANEGRLLRQEVRRALLKVKPPERRALYNDTVAKASDHFERTVREMKNRGERSERERRRWGLPY